MKTLRILLQAILIVLCLLLILASNKSTTADLFSLINATLFIVFLFGLTYQLKSAREKQYKIDSTNIYIWSLYSCGASLISQGCYFLIQHDSPTSMNSMNSMNSKTGLINSLLAMVNNYFGSNYSQIVAFFIWSVIGFILLIAGRKLQTYNSNTMNQ